MRRESLPASGAHTQPWNDWGRGQAWYRGGEFGRDRFNHFYGYSPFFYPGWYGGWPYYDYGSYGYWPYYGAGYASTYDYGVDNPTYAGTVSYASPSEPTVEPESARRARNTSGKRERPFAAATTTRPCGWPVTPR